MSIEHEEEVVIEAISSPRSLYNYDKFVDAKGVEFVIRYFWKTRGGRMTQVSHILLTNIHNGNSKEIKESTMKDFVLRDILTYSGTMTEAQYSTMERDHLIDRVGLITDSNQ